MVDAPILVCVSGVVAGRSYIVSEAGLTAGRADGHDIVLKDDDVSRDHARFQYDNGSLWLRDLGSRNGVYVNDTRLASHKELRVGDVVRIGGSTFEIRWASDTKSDDEASADDSNPRRSWFRIFDR